jgi:hypothetical protein
LDFGLVELKQQTGEFHFGPANPYSLRRFNEKMADAIIPWRRKAWLRTSKSRDVDVQTVGFNDAFLGKIS